jgi:hypothetical protein
MVNRLEGIKVGFLPIAYQGCFVNAMNKCGKTRAVIAAEMNSILRREAVSKSSLDDLARASRMDKPNFRFPLEWVSPFCEVTGSDELARLMMGPHLRKRVEIGDRVLEGSATLREALELTSKLIAPHGDNERVKS